MSPETAGFHFELSSAELRWLASAFGVTRFPLRGSALNSLPEIQIKVELKKGLESLNDRGLVQRVSANWQVDRLPSAIINWLGSATSMLILNIHSCEKPSSSLQIFIEQDANMVVENQDDTYRFLFLPGQKELTDHLLEKMGASIADRKQAPVKYSLSQPVTVLRTAWKDPSLAEQILKVIGLDPKASKTLLAWTGSLKWVASLEWGSIEAGSFTENRQAFLCGNSQGIWAGRSDKKIGDDLIELSPVTLEEMRNQIQSYL